MIHNKIVVRNDRDHFSRDENENGIRVVRLGSKSFEPKIQFLLNYQNGASGSDDSDPDSNFFNETSFKNFDTVFLDVYLSLRGLNANSDNFVELLENSSHSFNVTCLSETWISNNDFKNNLQDNLSNYISIPFESKGV